MFTFDYKGGEEPREVTLVELNLEDLGDGLQKMMLFATLSDIMDDPKLGKFHKCLQMYIALVPIYKEMLATDKTFNDFDWFHPSVPFMEISMTTWTDWSINFTLFSQSSSSQAKGEKKNKISKK